MRSVPSTAHGFCLSATQRLLQQLQTPRSPQGSTVFNLILALLGLGIVGFGAMAIFLPQTFSCGNKAKTAEARQMVGAIGRGQQAYYFEQKKFTSSLPVLGLGIQPESKNYRYTVQTIGNAGFGYAEAKSEYTLRTNTFGPFEWVSQGSPIRSYVVGVFPHQPKANAANKSDLDTRETVRILCEVEKIGPGPINPPTYQNGKLACGSGSNLIQSSLEH